MKWQQGKWVKKLLFGLLLFLLIVIIIIAGLTFYINKILTYEKLLEKAQEFSNTYLDRNLSFRAYEFNIFKGIILKELHIEKNTNITDTTEVFVKEVNLLYDFKQFLKMKLYINKIIINNIDLEINEQIISKELEYYQDKFNLLTPAPDQEEEIKEKEGAFNIRLIEIVDSHIVYRKNNKKIEFNISSLALDNSLKKKIEKDITIIYKNEKIIINGETFLYTNSALLNWDVELPRRGIYSKINIQTTNFSEFTLKSKIKYHGDNYNITSSFLKKENKIFIPLLLINDHKNKIYIKNGIINLKSLNSFFNLSGKLNKIDNQYLTPFFKTEGVNFSGNFDINLNITMNLNYPEDLLLSGNILVKESGLNVDEERFFFKKSSINIEKNRVEARSGEVIYREHDFLFDISSKDLFSSNPIYNIIVRIKRFDINKFITLKEPFKSRISDLRLESSLILKEKKINFKNISFNLLNGRVNADGFFDFKKSNRLAWQVNQAVDNIDLQRLFKNLRIKQDVNGRMTGVSFIKGYIADKKFYLEGLSGKFQSQINLTNIGNLDLQAAFILKDNRININKSYVIYDYNKIWFIGSYNTESKILKLKGENNKIFLNSIKSLEQKYTGRVDFNFTLQKKLEGSDPLKGVIDLKSPEIIYDNLKFREISGNISVISNTYKGDISINNFYKGKITSKLQKDTEERINVQTEAKNIKLEPLIKDWANQNVSGFLDWKLNFTLKDKKINGEFDAKVKKGEMEDTPYQIKIDNHLNNLFELQHRMYKNIVINVKIKNNLVEFTRFDILSPYWKCKIDGTYNLQTKYNDLLFDISFHEESIKHAIQQAYVAGYIRENKAKWYYIKYMTVKGTGAKIKTDFK